MKIRFFLDNPIFAGVISVLIVALGVLAMFSLPVERFPDIAPPTVTVTAVYPGAKAETVQKSVIAPLEEAINGVEDINYITSTADNSGLATITVYFRQGTDADMAAVNVQNRVTTVTGLLPAEVVRAGISTEKKINSELMTLMLYSPGNRFDEAYVDNYMNSIVVPRIERLAGVSGVYKFGFDYALRIWLKPDMMAHYGLVPADVQAALDDQNIEAATGSFGEDSPGAYQYSLKYHGRLTTPQEFADIIIRSLDDGSVLRLGDVAHIEMGRENYTLLETAEGWNSSGVSIYQAQGSNAREAITRLKAEIDKISESLPKGLEFAVLNDASRFLDASVRDVAVSFFLAIILVLLVVYFFIQDLRATIIPAIGIIVSITGTFAFLYIAGFSINLLTLFALVLCIGTVVDDSIVVVEAVQERYVEGYTSHYKASHDAMGNVSTAILISTFIFMSVFIPVSMIGGTAGTFYRQFGLTMAAAVGISGINALTLSPVLSVLLIRPLKDKNGNERNDFSARFSKAFQASFNAFADKYRNGVAVFIRHKWLSFTLLGVCIAGLAVMASVTKKGLVPQEDSGIVFVCTSTTPGTSLSENAKLLHKADSLFRTFPEIELCVEEAGFSFTGNGPNMGQFFILLKDWKYRKGPGHSAQDVVSRVYEVAAQIPELSMIAMQNSMIPGYSIGSNVELFLQDLDDRGIDRFKEVSDGFVAALNNRPELELAYASFSSDYPQYEVQVDVARCMRAGVQVSEVLSTMGTYLGGQYVSNFNRFSRLFKIMLQAGPESRVDAKSLDHFYVRTGNGMAPLSQFVTLSRCYGPEYLTRFNLYNSISVSASPAPGYSSGQVLQAIQETAQQALPSGYTYELGGLAREEESSGGNLLVIILVSVALIYLILSSLYSSFVLPLVIIMAVPCGLAGSFLFAWLYGLENNIYLQTAVIMLIGLLSKTAILITDYAGRNRAMGMSLYQSAIDAARMRLRPILMTSLTMIIGMIPLMMAKGAGSLSNRTIGACTVGGMLFGTLAMLFIVPCLWMLMQTLHENLKTRWFKSTTSNS